MAAELNTTLMSNLVKHGIIGDWTDVDGDSKLSAGDKMVNRLSSSPADKAIFNQWTVTTADLESNDAIADLLSRASQRRGITQQFKVYSDDVHTFVLYSDVDIPKFLGGVVGNNGSYHDIHDIKTYVVSKENRTPGMYNSVEYSEYNQATANLSDYFDSGSDVSPVAIAAAERSIDLFIWSYALGEFTPITNPAYPGRGYVR